MTQKRTNNKKQPKTMPTAERVAAELATARSMDDFFGRDGIFAKLFAATMEEMKVTDKVQQPWGGGGGQQQYRLIQFLAAPSTFGYNPRYLIEVANLAQHPAVFRQCGYTLLDAMRRL